LRAIPLEPVADVTLAAEPVLDADDQPGTVSFVPHLPLGQLEPGGLSVGPAGHAHHLAGQPEQD